MLLTKKASGKVRYKSITENEKLHFFEDDHTYHCWPTRMRRRDPIAFDDARGRLMGNIYFPGHIAFLVAEYLFVAGWIEEPLSVHELAQCRARLQSRGAPGQGYAVEEALREGGENTLRRLVRWLFLQQSYRGDVRCIMGTPHIKHMWQEVPARWFRWSVVLSIPWAQRGDHINLCESRGRCLSIKLRARHRQLHRSRYLHLLDSQVNLCYLGGPIA